MATKTLTKPEQNGTTLPPQFQSFNKENSLGHRAAALECSITLSGSGNVRLSNKLSETLRVKNGAGVAFHYDTSEEAWYIERDDVHGFTLRVDKKGQLQFNSSVLHKRITEGLDLTSGRMKVSEEPLRISTQLLYPVLTSSLKGVRKPKD